jgi:hypothetical protein
MILSLPISKIKSVQLGCFRSRNFAWQGEGCLFNNRELYCFLTVVVFLSWIDLLKTQNCFPKPAQISRYKNLKNLNFDQTNTRNLNTRTQLINVNIVNTTL